MNVRELVTETQRIAGRVDNTLRDRTRRALNAAQRRWAQKTPWPSLRQTEDFPTTGAQTLILPSRVMTILSIADRTNKRKIDPSSQFFRQYPDEYLAATAGAPLIWRELGVRPVFSEPGAAAPSQLVVNTTASDSFVAHVTGLAANTTASGTADYLYYVEEEVDVSSDADFTTTNLFAHVHSFGKNDITPADVRLWHGSDPIARIRADEYRSAYKVVETVFKAPAGTLLSVEYLRAPAALVGDNQVPEPAVNTDFLTWYAAGLLLKQFKDHDMAQQAFVEAERIRIETQATQNDWGDQDRTAIPDMDYWGNENQYGI